MVSNFALVYSEAGRGQEALELMERVMEAYTSTLSEEHPNTLHSVRTLQSLKKPSRKPAEM